jgi:hypothetical protein
MDERRKFERINLPSSAQVFAEKSNGERLGEVVVLGRGGMLVNTDKNFPPDTKLTLHLVDNSEGIRREVQAVTRYKLPEGMGFEFEQLDPDAAVEIGVIIGKYYSAVQ